MKTFSQYSCVILLILFIIFLILWESKIAPILPGGSTLVLKAVPLCFAFLGILKGVRRSFQKLTLILQFYFLEALVRVFEAFPVNLLALIEFFISLILFIFAILFLKAKS